MNDKMMSEIDEILANMNLEPASDADGKRETPPDDLPSPRRQAADQIARQLTDPDGEPEFMSA